MRVHFLLLDNPSSNPRVVFVKEEMTREEALERYALPGEHYLYWLEMPLSEIEAGVLSTYWEPLVARIFREGFVLGEKLKI